MTGPKDKDTLDVTAEQVLDLIVETLQTHLNLSIEGSKCGTLDVLRLLVAASAEQSSIESACQETESSPSGNRVREQLEAELPQELEELRTLEAAFNEALVGRVPRCVFKRSRQVAIDLVLIPYHGQPDKDEREVRRGRAKQGTTHFHCYASAYIILKNKRYTLALTYVWGDERVVQVLKRLLARLKELEICIKRLFLDREFYNVVVIRYLKTQNVWFVMPVIVRGKKGGTRGLLRKQKKSARTTYTMRSPTDGKVTFELVFVQTYLKGKFGKHGRRWYAFAVFGVNAQPRQVYEMYRLRFGIESSYRMMNQVRARTCSRKPSLRLLLVGVAFTILNLWSFIRWNWLGQPQRGGRSVNGKLFHLHRMARMLSRAVEAIYGCVLSVPRPIALPS
jgi:putative transposase